METDERQIIRGQREIKLANFEQRAGAYTLAAALVAAFLTVPGGQAMAGNECGADTAGANTITCTAPAYSTGINYGVVDVSMLNDNNDGLTLRLDNPAMVVDTSPNSAGAIGLHAPFVTPDGSPVVADLVVDVVNAGTIMNTTPDRVAIFLMNEGKGGAFVTLRNGNVVSAGPGILATNDSGFSASDGAIGDIGITIEGGTISAPNGPGAQALQAGAGDAYIRMNGGRVTALEGLDARNYSGYEGNALTELSGGTVTTNGFGLRAFIQSSQGTGDATTNMSGGTVSTTGDGGNGASAMNSGTGNATVNLSGSSQVTTAGAGSFGLYALGAGAGKATVKMTGGTVATTGAGSNGLYASNTGTGSAQVSVSGGSVSASGKDADGIFASSVGGQYAVNVDGATIAGGSNNGSAIHTTAAAGGTVDIGPGATIDGSRSGIAIRDGDADRDGVDEIGGDTVINTAGNVTGNVIMGRGNDTINLTGGVLNGDIYGDDKVASANDGNDTFNWTGGRWGGSFFGGNGSDTVNISAAGFDAHHVLDGGDDVSTADGWTDRLTFNGINAATNGANLINWESLTVNGGQLRILDGALTVGSDEGTGLFLTGNGNLDGGDRLALTGNLSIDPGSSFIGSGGGAGVYSVLGNVQNGGNITMQNGGVGDVLTINGNYNGKGGTVRLDTVLGDDSSKTDKLVVNGDVTGDTHLSVNNVGGPGALTNANGINVVDVNGKSDPGAFKLNGDYTTRDNRVAVVGGAYAYTLYHGGVGADANNSNWYLRSQLTDPVTPTNPVTPVNPASPANQPSPQPAPPMLYQAGAPLYEAYPQALLALSGLPTLNQRVGNRYWDKAGLSGSEMVFCKDADNNAKDASKSIWCAASPKQDDAAVDDGTTRRKGGSWARVEGGHNRFEPKSSTTSSTYDQDLWKLQAGVDGVVNETDTGELVAGLMAYYGSIETDVHSIYGDGKIDTTGYGVGATLTWFGSNGVYVDGQAMASFFDSDLSSKETGRGLVGSNNGNGYTVSVESGKRIQVAPEWTLTPQAQLLYSRVDFDTFADAFGAKVSLDDGDSLKGRVGLALERQTKWKDESSQIRHVNVYGIANVYNEFLDGTKVDVADVKFANRNDRLWGGVGVGGIYSWDNDTHSVYGELSVNTSLENFADSSAVAGNVGYKFKF